VVSQRKERGLLSITQGEKEEKAKKQQGYKKKPV